MGQFQKPSDHQVQRFLAAQSRQDFSYRETGYTEGRSPAGYDLDHNRVLLGTGPAVFERACRALQTWSMFPAPWVEIRPNSTPIQVGNVVAMVAHVFGLWWLNACRIVYVIDQSGPIRRSGFAYGTLPGHIESGEERFLIEWQRDDTVWYDMRAFSRPRHWLARLGYPLARRLQKRFVVESQATMRQLAANPPLLAPTKERR